MISIITAIYNQLSMNQLFYENVKKSTHYPFELIIIDNNSDDGSREFFEQKKDVVLIKNSANYNYPHCQNQGIEVAKYDVLCFLNNDIILPKNWDLHVVEHFKREPRLGVLSVASNEQVENQDARKKLSRKWRNVKRITKFFMGLNTRSLKTMKKLMYGDFDAFAEARFKKWGYQLIEGYSGSAIIIKRDALEVVGLWDERLQHADFDLFNRAKIVSLENENLLPIQLALGIYIHHYQRLTEKMKYPPFENSDSMIGIGEKWGDKTNELRKDIVGEKNSPLVATATHGSSEG